MAMIPVLISRMLRSSALASFCSTMRTDLRRRRCARYARSRADRPVRRSGWPARRSAACASASAYPPGSAARRRRAPASSAALSTCGSACCTAWPVPSCGSCSAQRRSGASRSCAPRRRHGRKPDRCVVRRQAARRIDDMRDERLAGERMQHLGQVGMHALALAGRENDDIHWLTPLVTPFEGYRLVLVLRPSARLRVQALCRLAREDSCFRAFLRHRLAAANSIISARCRARRRNYVTRQSLHHREAAHPTWCGRAPCLGHRPSPPDSDALSVADRNDPSEKHRLRARTGGLHDCPDDQRLATPHVTGGEDLGNAAGIATVDHRWSP
jgi:hypothetical protein